MLYWSENSNYFDQLRPQPLKQAMLLLTNSTQSVTSCANVIERSCENATVYNMCKHRPSPGPRFNC